MRQRILACIAVAIVAAVAVVVVGPLAAAGGFQPASGDCTGGKCK